MRKIKIIVILSCLACFLLVLFHSESAKARSSFSDMYVHIKYGRSDQKGLTVIAQSNSGWYKLKYTLTPWGWVYYGYVKAGNYKIYVSGRKMHRIYLRGRRVGQVYAPGGSYVDVTCRM